MGARLASRDTLDRVTGFVRFQSSVPNRNGRYPGVFALANGLAWGGTLTPEDHAWWRRTNDLCNTLYSDPEKLQPGTYAYPGARSWFTEDCQQILTETTRRYLDLLDRYQVRWTRLSTTDPGHILYEDADQVVAAPYTGEDWPLSPGRARFPRDHA